MEVLAQVSTSSYCVTLPCPPSATLRRRLTHLQRVPVSGACRDEVQGWGCI